MKKETSHEMYVYVSESLSASASVCVCQFVSAHWTSFGGVSERHRHRHHHYSICLWFF